MVFRTNTKDIDINDERDAVLNFENPVRVRKGYEPRYSYTHENPKTNITETINIIMKTIKVGEWVVDKNDPTKLVEPGSKDALK